MVPPNDDEKGTLNFRAPPGRAGDGLRVYAWSGVLGDKPNSLRMAAFSGSVWGHSASAANWIATRRSSIDLIMVLSWARAVRANVLLSVFVAFASIRAWRKLRSLVFFAAVMPGRVSAAVLLIMVWEVCNRLGL